MMTDRADNHLTGRPSLPALLPYKILRPSDRPFNLFSDANTKLNIQCGASIENLLPHQFFQFLYFGKKKFEKINRDLERNVYQLTGWLQWRLLAPRLPTGRRGPGAAHGGQRHGQQPPAGRPPHRGLVPARRGDHRLSQAPSYRRPGGGAAAQSQQVTCHILAALFIITKSGHQGQQK